MAESGGAELEAERPEGKPGTAQKDAANRMGEDEADEAGAGYGNHATGYEGERE